MCIVNSFFDYRIEPLGFCYFVASPSRELGCFMTMEEAKRSVVEDMAREIAPQGAD